MKPHTHTMKTDRTWLNQFGASYEVPAEILAATIDLSWGNDMCPCFIRRDEPTPDGEPMARLWVEHPDITMRELATQRFMVAVEGEDWLETDDAAAALAFFLALNINPPEAMDTHNQTIRIAVTRTNPSCYLWEAINPDGSLAGAGYCRTKRDALNDAAIFASTK